MAERVVAVAAALAVTCLVRWLPLRLRGGRIHAKRFGRALARSRQSLGSGAEDCFRDILS